jgi:16S rRNA (guanine966-N2)-methyltransferase
MRVISGTAKGRALRPAGAATRPITDRVKESLFDILAARVEEANVLDLFAGAGSVGIEALSRGARAATFVELDRDALRTIRTNLEATRLADHAQIVQLDVFRFLRAYRVSPRQPTAESAGSEAVASTAPPVPRQPPRAAPLRRITNAPPYDLIYVAPPQYKGLWAETLLALDASSLFAARGIVVAQIHPKEYQELALTTLEQYDQRKYGSTLLCFYRARNPNLLMEQNLDGERH